MLNRIALADDFTAVPYLPSSSLWQQYAKTGLSFSTDKPNVIVGPNGAGKSALLTLLALHTLTYRTGETALDDGYTKGREADAWWSERTWRNPAGYLPGALIDSDDAAARYYRPSHIPGNDDSVTVALMRGYSKEARAYDADVDKRSSGQGCQARLAQLISALTAPDWEPTYKHVNWSAGLEPRTLDHRGYVGPWDYRAEVLKKRRDQVEPHAIPVILMDEPEQSLDALAELTLWNALRQADCLSRQVIVATHSLYPFLHPEHFHVIEAVPGYLQQVREALGLTGDGAQG